MESKKIRNNQKGITLIALVVTVVVLIIIFGISVSRRRKDNGIVDNAHKAESLTAKSEVQEKMDLAVAAALIKGLDQVDETELEAQLTKYFGVKDTGYTLEGGSNSGWFVKIIEDDLVFFIDPDGIIDYDIKDKIVLGIVDDLGTRSTIYLYNNLYKFMYGTIDVKLKEYPENSTTESLNKQFYQAGGYLRPDGRVYSIYSY